MIRLDSITTQHGHQILFIDAGFSSGLPGGVVGGIKKATRP
jgi:hypothetical protein